MQAEEDHAGRLITDESRQAPKVQIEGEDTPIFPEGLCEDRLVRRSMEALVSPVDGIMTLLAQPSQHAQVHTHVGEEAHEGLRDADLVPRQPGGILHRLLDVLALEIRVASQDLVEGRAVGDLADDERDRNAQAADAGAAPP